MRTLLCLTSVVMLSAVTAQAATLDPGSLGNVNAEFVDIDPSIGGATDTDVNNTTEGENIYADWVTAGKPATGLIGAGPIYGVGASGGYLANRLDFSGTNNNAFTPNLPYPAGVGGDDFVIRAGGFVQLAAGQYTIHSEGDDGFSLAFAPVSGDPIVFSKFGAGSAQGAPNELRFEAPTGNHTTGGNFTLSQTSIFQLTGTFFERGGGDWWEVGIRSGLFTDENMANYSVFGHGALNDSVQFATALSAAAETPEPSAIALALVGLMGLAVRRRRRR